MGNHGWDINITQSRSKDLVIVRLTVLAAENSLRCWRSIARIHHNRLVGADVLVSQSYILHHVPQHFRTNAMAKNLCIRRRLVLNPVLWYFDNTHILFLDTWTRSNLAHAWIGQKPARCGRFIYSTIIRWFSHRCCHIDTTYHSGYAVATPNAPQNWGCANLHDGHIVGQNSCAVVSHNTDCYRACLSSGLSIYYRNVLSHSPDLIWNISPVSTVTWAPPISSATHRNRLTDHPRVLEMYVGIICACTPAAAKSFKHHVQRFDSLRTYISSYLPVSSLKRFKESSYTMSNGSTKAEREKFKHRQYSTVDEIYRSAQGKGNNISTYVQSGKHDDIENDGIHLTFEMQSEVSRAEH